MLYKNLSFEDREFDFKKNNKKFMSGGLIYQTRGEFKSLDEEEKLSGKLKKYQ